VVASSHVNERKPTKFVGRGPKRLSHQRHERVGQRLIVERVPNRAGEISRLRCSWAPASTEAQHRDQDTQMSAHAEPNLRKRYVRTTPHHHLPPLFNSRLVVDAHRPMPLTHLIGCRARLDSSARPRPCATDHLLGRFPCAALHPRSLADPPEAGAVDLAASASSSWPSPKYESRHEGHSLRALLEQIRLSSVRATVGLYGVMSFLVAQRTREVGVRIALGAEAGHVIRMVVGRGMLLAGLGAVVGLGIAAGLTRFARTLLFGVSPLDVEVFALMGAAVLTIAAFASWVPARRTVHVDPMEALRHE